VVSNACTAQKKAKMDQAKQLQATHQNEHGTRSLQWLGMVAGTIPTICKLWGQGVGRKARVAEEKGKRIEWKPGGGQPEYLRERLGGGGGCMNGPPYTIHSS
jgi:hypothetical protein